MTPVFLSLVAPSLKSDAPSDLPVTDKGAAVKNVALKAVNSKPAESPTLKSSVASASKAAGSMLWGAAKKAGAVATYSTTYATVRGIIYRVDYKKVAGQISKDRSEIACLLGSSGTDKLIDGLSSKINVFILPFIEAKFGQLNKSEKLILELCLRAILTKWLLNCAKLVKKESLSGKDPLAVSILGRLIASGSKFLSPIAQEIEAIKSLGNEEELRKKLQAFLAPFAHECLSLGFPNGMNDIELPYPLNQIAWNILKDLFLQPTEGVSGYFISTLTARNWIDLIEGFTEPLQDVGKLKLVAVHGAGGQFLTDQTEKLSSFAPVCCQGIMGLMKEPLAIKLADWLGVLGDKAPFLEFLKQVFEGVEKSEQEAFAKLWKFVGSYGIATLNDFLYYKSLPSDLATEADAELIKPLTHHLLNPFYEVFFGSFAAGIDEEYQKIEAIKDETIKEEELKKLFQPVAWYLIDFKEIKETNVIHLPFIKKEFEEALEEQFPLYLAMLYKEIRVKPHFLDKMSQKLMPVLKKDEPLEAKISTLKGVKQLDQANEVLAQNIVPPIKAKIAGSSSLLASLINSYLKSCSLGTIEPKWMEEVIKNLALSDALLVQSLWKNLSQSLGRIMTLGMKHFAAAGDVKAGSHILPIIIKRLMRISSEYFAKNQTSIDQLLKKLEGMGNGPEKEALIYNQFATLGTEALKEAGLDHIDWLPNIPNIRPALLKEIKTTYLPQFLYHLYRDLHDPQNGQSALDAKLTDFLLDSSFALKEISDKEMRDAWKETTQSHVSLVENAKNLFLQKSGVPSLAVFMKDGFSFLSDSLKGSIHDFLDQNPLKVAHLISEILPSAPFPQEVIDWLKEGIKELVNDKDPLVKQGSAYVGAALESALLKIFLNAGETVDKAIPKAANAHKQSLLLGNGVVYLLAILQKHEYIEAEVAACDQISDPVEKLAKLREAFKPLALEFLKIASSDPMKDMPLPAVFKEDLLEAIQSIVLPDVIARIYRNLSFWSTKKEIYQKELKELYGDQHVAEAASLIAFYSGDFIPYFLAKDSESLAKILELSMEGFFGKSAKIENYLKANRPAVELFLSQNIKHVPLSKHQIEGSKTDVVEWAKKPIRNFIEPLLLMVFSELSKKIRAFEDPKSSDYQPLFIVSLFTELLKVAHDHFLQINAVTKRSDKSNAYKVPFEKMCEGFGDQLHKGIPKNSKMSKEEQDEWRLKHFYQPLVHRLCLILDIENRPDFKQYFDSETKLKIWKQFKEELAPSLMHSLFLTLLDEGTIRELLLSSLSGLNEALKELEEPIKTEASPTEEDDEQNHLNEVSGKLVLELINLVPRTFAHSVLEIDGVKAMTAQKVGKAVRKSLSEWSVLKLIGKGVIEGLPSFHPGTWEKKGSMKFVPLNGKFDFALPLTGEALRKYDAAKQMELKATAFKLKQMMAAMLSKQIKATVSNVASAYWNRIHKAVDYKIERFLGKRGLQAKQGLDRVFHKIIFDCLGALLKILLHPANRFFWYLFEKYLAEKSDDLTKDAIHKIQENLLFNLTDKLLEMMEQKSAADVK